MKMTYLSVFSYEHGSASYKERDEGRAGGQLFCMRLTMPPPPPPCVFFCVWSIVPVVFGIVLCFVALTDTIRE